MKEMQLVERLKQYMADNNLTANALAQNAGIDPGNFRKMITGAQKITGRTIAKIAASEGINQNWLLTGEGEMLAEQHEAPAETKPHIPVEVAAGGVSFAQSAVLAECERRPVIPAFPLYDYTITAKGDSMLPQLESGDILAIRQVFDFIEWGKIYVVSTRDGAVVKKLYPVDGRPRALRCISTNPDYPPFVLDESNILAVYKVVGSLRVY